MADSGLSLAAFANSRRDREFEKKNPEWWKDDRLVNQRLAIQGKVYENQNRVFGKGGTGTGTGTTGTGSGSGTGSGANTNLFGSLGLGFGEGGIVGAAKDLAAYKTKLAQQDRGNMFGYRTKEMGIKAGLERQMQELVGSQELAQIGGKGQQERALQSLVGSQELAQIGAKGQTERALQGLLGTQELQQIGAKGQTERALQGLVGTQQVQQIRERGGIDKALEQLRQTSMSKREGAQIASREKINQKGLDFQAAQKQSDRAAALGAGRASSLFVFNS
jgi:hypothetical protein